MAVVEKIVQQREFFGYLVVLTVLKPTCEGRLGLLLLIKILMSSEGYLVI